MRLDTMRVTIMLAMGLQTGCLTTASLVADDTDDTDDTGEITASCAEASLATAANVLEIESKGGNWLVCADKPASGECEALEELVNYKFVYDNLGPPSDADFCGWNIVPVCGPEESIQDACCYVFNLSVICEGRPLRVEGTHQMASVQNRDDWQTALALDVQGLSQEQRRTLADLWRDSALAEHASVAAFARFTLELLTLGAPAELIEETQRAMGDEIRHARLCFSLSSIFEGHAVGPGEFEGAGIGSAVHLTDTMMGLVLDGCINETIAAAVVQAESQCASDKALGGLLAELAEDERRHSTLSWKALRWILNQHPERRAEVKGWFAEGLAAQWNQEVEEHTWSHSWGRLSGVEKKQVIQRTILEVISPCAKQLLAATAVEAGQATTLA